eukprot:1867929-Prymnesium_polylepis.1
MSLPRPLLAMRPLGRVGWGPPEPRSPAVRAVGVAAPDLGQLRAGPPPYIRAIVFDRFASHLHPTP